MSVLINPFSFGVVVPFVPTDFANQEFWYDATDADTITDAGGGEVSAWTDKFNSHDLSQGTAARQPNIGTINSIDSLFFDGDDVFNLTSQSFTTAPCTQFGLITPVTTIGGHLWFMKNSGSSINRVHVDAPSNLNCEAFASSGSGSLPALASVLVNGTTIAFVARHASSTTGVSETDDETTGSDATVGTLEGSADQILVGASAGSGADGWNGHIHHLGLYSARLSDADTATLLAYLVAQGGL